MKIAAVFFFATIALSAFQVHAANCTALDLNDCTLMGAIATIPNPTETDCGGPCRITQCCQWQDIVVTADSGSIAQSAACLTNYCLTWPKMKSPSIRLEIVLKPVQVVADIVDRVGKVTSDAVKVTTVELWKTVREVVGAVLDPLLDVVLALPIGQCAGVFGAGYLAESIRYDQMREYLSIRPVKINIATQRQIECFYKCDTVSKANIIFEVKTFTNTGAQTFGDNIYIGTDRARDYNELLKYDRE